MSAPRRAPRLLTRAQVLLLYLVLTAAIATGLALFTSASTSLALLRTATSGLFLPVLLSLIVAFLLDPLVRLVEGERVSRTTAIFVVYFLGFLLLYLAGSGLAPQWQEMWASLQADLPRYTAELTGLLSDLQGTLLDRFPFVEEYDLPGRARTLAEQFVGQALAQTPRSALRIGSLLVLVPILTFFFLRDGGRIMRSAVDLTPNRYFEMVHELSALVTRQLAQFIRGRLLEGLIVGLVVAGGLALTDIRYAPILGLIAGVTNLIPYVGPIVGMVPGILIALVDLGMGGEFWWIVAVYVLIAQVLVDNFILIPILISRVSNLHPLWVILAIIMGGKLYGVLGMIIGVPVASIVKIVLTEVRHYRTTLPLAAAALDRERPG